MIARASANAGLLSRIGRVSQIAILEMRDVVRRSLDRTIDLADPLSAGGGYEQRRTPIAVGGPALARRDVSRPKSAQTSSSPISRLETGGPQMWIPRAGRRTSSAVYSKNSWVCGERPSQPAWSGSCCQPD
jgi:hypothetical protein